VKATLSLIKQRRGEYGNGYLNSPIKDSHWIIWLSFRVLYGWIMSWRNLYGKYHFDNGAKFSGLCVPNFKWLIGNL